MEMEIKLTVRPAIAGGPDAFFAMLAELPDLAGLTLGPVHRFVVHDTYFDTQAGALAQAGSGLRLRVVNGRALVTFKQNRTQQGALAQREEYEAELTQPNLTAVLAHASPQVGPGPFPVTDFAQGRPCGSLVPILRVHTTRLARTVGDAAELTLDLVQYPDRSATAYHDVEVEGQAEPLLRRAEAELQSLAHGHLDPATLSKLARGHRLKG